MQNIPLAERLRPKTLDEYIGQKHIVGENAPLRKAIMSGNIPSIILWGPPGVGKTTLAKLLANELELPFYTLSAINSGVKEVREVIDNAKKRHLFQSKKPILFIDEIHRFNKSQQDSLLGAVEQGLITLIGATTENPSFEVISALLSRCQVYVLEPLSTEELDLILHRALTIDEVLKTLDIEVKEKEALFRVSSGDARKLLNALELLINQEREGKIAITNKKVIQVIQQNLALYDKNGEQHYDIISAFIKSIRGSDPNAAVYWLARMIEGGEDLKFIARRMLILASEDIGNANPTALVIANNCFQAVQVIGYPESEIILSQTAVYLATSPKSNASYKAIKEAKELVRKTGNLPVPLHLRNAPTKLMKDLNYGREYQYAHNFENNFANQEYMPSEISGQILYNPGNNPKENKIKEFLKHLWKGKYKY
jgi:putative ATPase